MQFQIPLFYFTPKYNAPDRFLFNAHAFLRFPAFLGVATSAPDAVVAVVPGAAAGEDDAASRASRTSGEAWRRSWVLERMRLGSSLPTRGTPVASISWKGTATKVPLASNHFVKDSEMSMVVGVGDLVVMVALRKYVGMFFLVEVEMLI